MARCVNKLILVGTADAVESESDSDSSGGPHLVLVTRTQMEDGTFTGPKTHHRLICEGRWRKFVKEYVTVGDRLYVEGRVGYAPAQSEPGDHPSDPVVYVHVMVLLRRPKADAG